MNFYLFSFVFLYVWKLNLHLLSFFGRNLLIFWGWEYLKSFFLLLICSLVFIFFLFCRLWEMSFSIICWFCSNLSSGFICKRFFNIFSFFVHQKLNKLAQLGDLGNMFLYERYAVRGLSLNEFYYQRYYNQSSQILTYQASLRYWVLTF